MTETYTRAEFFKILLPKMRGNSPNESQKNISLDASNTTDFSAVDFLHLSSDFSPQTLRHEAELLGLDAKSMDDCDLFQAVNQAMLIQRGGGSSDITESTQAEKSKPKLAEET